MAPRKVDWALAARSVVTQFAEAAERVAELDAILTDSGYDSGGSDPITDEDVQGHDMTAAQIAAFHTFAGNLDTFITPAVAAAINAFRNM